MRLLALSAVLFAASFAAGDDKKPEKKEAPKGEAVTGKVNLDGQPVPGGTITFTSKDGKTSVAAEIKDGEYKATVPAGEYDVSFKEPAPKDKDKKDAPPFKIPAKYGDPKTSGIVAKVTAGKNNLDFELRSK